MAGQFGTEYAVDIVFCIDATGSMVDIIEKTKSKAKELYPELQGALIESGRNVSQIRVKVIMFRDFYFDKKHSFAQTEFLTLPEEINEYESFLNLIKAAGGGDEPENGLEALAAAINSDWTMDGDKRRHIIVMYTDASAHPLEKAQTMDDKIKKYYPENMPGSLIELIEMWNNPSSDSALTNLSQRLILFAPSHEIWDEVAALCVNTIYKPSQAGNGLEEIEYKEIINCIVKSV